MSKKIKIAITLGFVAVVIFIMSSTMKLGKVSCEICIDFKGRNACRSAAGTTKDEAITAAKGTACADIASGRDDSIACNDRTPLTSEVCKP